MTTDLLLFPGSMNLPKLAKTFLLTGLASLAFACPRAPSLPPALSPEEAAWLASFEQRNGQAVVDTTITVTWSAIPIGDVDRAELPQWLGRPPMASEEAMLSHPFWTDVFDGEPTAIGRAIDLDGRAVMIVGVLPDELGDDAADLWVVVD